MTTPMPKITASPPDTPQSHPGPAPRSGGGTRMRDAELIAGHVDHDEDEPQTEVD